MKKQNIIDSESTKTTFQNCITLESNFIPNTVLDLDIFYKKILEDQISSQWLVQNEENEIKENFHRVMINNTRFSTFAIFTDGQRVIVYDRQKDKPNTNVENNRYDVFGSVQFENHSVYKKIKNKKFFNSKIVDLEQIPGFAIEDNISIIDKQQRETVVMIGLCIYVLKEDLDLAVLNCQKGEVKIFSIDNILDEIDINMLTSKAALGIKYLLNKINRKIHV